MNRTIDVIRRRKTTPALLLSAAIVLLLSGAGAQEPTPESVARAKTAVEVVTNIFKINLAAKVPGNDKALDKDGSWSARPARPEEQPAVCEAQGASCSEVIYRAGPPEITCLWTVLFPEKGEARVVRDNAASAEYMVVEQSVLKKGDPGLPKILKHAEMDLSNVSGGKGDRGGLVDVRIIVNKAGDVQGEVVDRSTNKSLDPLALAAAAKFKFSPLLIDGRPHTFGTRLSFSVQVF